MYTFLNYLYGTNRSQLKFTYVHLISYVFHLKYNAGRAGFLSKPLNRYYDDAYIYFFQSLLW